MHDLRLSADFLEHDLGQLEHGEFTRITNVDRSNRFRLLHQPQEALNEVIDIAEGTRLRSVAINRDILPAQGLDDEVRDDATVIRVHAGTVSVENPHDADVHAILPVVIEKQRLGTAFALVVAGAAADRVDIAPVAFRLRVHRGVTVDLRSGSLEDAGFDPFGQAEAIDRPHDRSLGRLDRIVLVMRRRGRAGQIVNAINLELERVDDIVTDQFEVRIPQQMFDVLFSSGEKIVEADDIMPLTDETVAQVGSQKS